MKRATIFLLAICIGVFSLTGCGISSHKKHEQGSVIYSFSGEDDSISVSNGVIVLDAKEETLYGGDFKYKKSESDSIVKYSTTIYFESGGERVVLMSHSVEDMSGEIIKDIAGNMGKMSGNGLRIKDIDKFVNDFWFALETTDLNGKKHTYQLQLQLTSITGKDGN